MAIDTRNMDALIAEIRAGKVTATGQAFSSSPKTEGGVSFADALQKAIENVNQTQDKAHEMADAYISGKSNVNLHEVMLNIQRSDIAFQEMVRAKEKLVAAYNDIMKMPL